MKALKRGTKVLWKGQKGTITSSFDVMTPTANAYYGGLSKFHLRYRVQVGRHVYVAKPEDIEPA